MSSAKAGLGTTINRAGTPVPEVQSIACGPKADSINVTNMDSTAGWAEFLAGIKEAGTITFSGNWTKTAAQTVLITDLGGATQTWTIVYANSGGTVTVTAYVSAFSIDTKFDGAQEFSCTLQITGAFALA